MKDYIFLILSYLCLHCATRLLTVQSVIQMCSATSSLSSLEPVTSTKDKEQATEAWKVFQPHIYFILKLVVYNPGDTVTSLEAIY